MYFYNQFNSKWNIELRQTTNNIGEISWPAYQTAPSLCGAFPHLFGNKKDVMCLIVMAVDQVP